jgi:sarcosine oxidase subunit beta
MPDVLPVIGPSRTRPGLIHAFGFSGHGFALGPAVGAVLAELVLDGRTGTPLEGFDICRFAGQDAPPADHWHTRV